MKTLEFHPISKLWPIMDEAHLNELAESIKLRGLRHPILLYEGMILDGRNRYLACQKCAFEPQFEIYKGDDPIADAVAENEKRRHLNTTQRSAIAVEIEKLEAKEAKKRMAAGGGDHRTGVPKVAPPLSDQGKARDKAAKLMGVAHSYVSTAKNIARDAPDVFKRMLSGEIKTMQQAQREARKIPRSEWTDDEKARKSQCENGKTVLANYERDKNLIAWAEKKNLAVAIDRTSKFGNPFLLGPDGTRDEVCDKFKKYYLPHKPSILTILPDLKGKVLCCHCYPERCHGESLL